MKFNNIACRRFNLIDRQNNSVVTERRNDIINRLKNIIKPAFGKIERIYSSGTMHEPIYVGTWKTLLTHKCFKCNTKFSFNPYFGEGYPLNISDHDINMDCPICKASDN